MAVALARRAITADRDDALVLAAAGFVLVMIARDYNQGLQAVNRARELWPIRNPDTQDMILDRLRIAVLPE